MNTLLTSAHHARRLVLFCQVELPDMKMPTPCISKLDCESPDQCCDFGALGLWCANPAKCPAHVGAICGKVLARLRSLLCLFGISMFTNIRFQICCELKYINF